MLCFSEAGNTPRWLLILRGVPLSIGVAMIFFFFYKNETHRIQETKWYRLTWLPSTK